MVTAAHARHQLSAVARDGDGAVAAYVFAHEYAVPPSGGPGPEVTCPTSAPSRRTAAAAWPPGCSRACSAARARPAIRRRASTSTPSNPTGALGIYERAGFRQSYREDFYHLDE